MIRKLFLLAVLAYGVNGVDWTFGAERESCDQACSSAGLGACNYDAINALRTRDDVKAIAGPWKTCTQGGGSGGTWAIPYGYTGNDYCFAVDDCSSCGGNATPCGTTNTGTQRRFCACGEKSLFKGTDGTSCSRVCAALGGTCNQAWFDSLTSKSKQQQCDVMGPVLGISNPSCVACSPNGSTNSYCHPGTPNGNQIYTNGSGAYNCGGSPDSRITPVCPCNGVTPSVLVKGAKGSSCENVCSALGKPCNQDWLDNFAFNSMQQQCDILQPVLGISNPTCRACGPNGSTNTYCYPGLPSDSGNSIYTNGSGAYQCTTSPDSRVTPVCSCGGSPGPKQSDCVAGEFFTGTSCDACAAGEWQPAAGQDSCNPWSRIQSSCGAGHFFVGGDATTDSSCHACAAGTWAIAAAYLSCTAHSKSQASCTVGQFYEAGTPSTDSSCPWCPWDKYQDQAGQASCKPKTTAATCSAGFGNFVNNGATTKDDQCTACGANEWSAAGQACQAKTAASSCAAGSFLQDNGAGADATCDACGGGTFSAAGASSCDAHTACVNAVVAGTATADAVCQGRGRDVRQVAGKYCKEAGSATYKGTWYADELEADRVCSKNSNCSAVVYNCGKVIGNDPGYATVAECTELKTSVCGSHTTYYGIDQNKDHSCLNKRRASKNKKGSGCYYHEKKTQCLTYYNQNASGSGPLDQICGWSTKMKSSGQKKHFNGNASSKCRSLPNLKSLNAVQYADFGGCNRAVKQNSKVNTPPPTPPPTEEPTRPTRPPKVVTPPPETPAPGDACADLAMADCKSRNSCQWDKQLMKKITKWDKFQAKGRQAGYARPYTACVNNMGCTQMSRRGVAVNKKKKQCTNDAKNDCMWVHPGTCIDRIARICSHYSGASKCNKNDGTLTCYWNKYHKTCDDSVYSPVCADYKTNGKCKGVGNSTVPGGCFWDRNTKTCGATFVEDKCDLFNGNAKKCKNKTNQCIWFQPRQTCINKSVAVTCSEYTARAKCGKAGCHWDRWANLRGTPPPFVYCKDGAP